jgi:hypothetical protein
MQPSFGLRPMAPPWTGSASLKDYDMDLNYLPARERISLMRASTAAKPEARAAHAGLARGYRRLLADQGFPVGELPPRLSA